MLFLSCQKSPASDFPATSSCNLLFRPTFQMDITEMKPKKNRNFMSNNQWGYHCLNCQVLLFKVLLVASLEKPVSQ